MGLPEADTALFFFINKGIQNSFFDALMPFITKNAELVFLPLVAALLIKSRKEAATALALSLVAVAFADGAGHAMKDIFARQRPCITLENINLLVGCGSSFSMPSNHATNSFAFASTFFLLRRKLFSLLFILAAVAIGFSRVYVGVHYPSDVVAGMVVGAAAAGGSVYLFRWARRIYAQKSWEGALYLSVLLFSLFRIYFILTSPFDLSPDEAHYWEWSRRPDWSYYSKGPMIAYLILAGTSLFGDNVFGVRVFAVLLLAASSILIFRLGRDLYDEKAGLAAALLVNLVPLYSVFGVLLTIDSPFIFFWVLSLYLFWKAVEERYKSGRVGNSTPLIRGEITPPLIRGGREGFPDSRNDKMQDVREVRASRYFFWTALGLSIGLGMLTKYTMVFFYLSGFLFMVFTKEARRLLFTGGPYIAVIVGILVFSPVILWNADHGWVTLKHTAGQAHVYDGLKIAPKYFFEFLGSQLGVVTPVLFVMMSMALVKLRRSREGAFLFWFTVPVLLFFVMKSLQGKVQANWALPAYAAGFIAFSAWYVRDFAAAGKSVKALVVSVFVLSATVTAFAHFPGVLNLPPEKDPTARLVGWKELGRAVSDIHAEMAREGPVFIFSDRYQIASELAFYVEGQPVTYCVNLGRRMNQYDLWPGLENLAGRNAIFVRTGIKPLPGQLSAAFRSCEKRELELKTEQDKIMKSTVFKCYDFKGIEPISPEKF
jgi:undecaprenyl-diphosphatase